MPRLPEIPGRPSKQECSRPVKFLKPLVDVFPADTATTPKSDQRLDYIFIDPGYKVKSKKVEKFKTSSGQPVSDHYGLGVQLVILGTHNNPAERSQLENEAKLKQEYPRLVKFLKPLVDVFPADTATTPKSDQRLDCIFIDPGYKVKSKKVEKFKTSSGQPVSDHYGLGVQLVILGTHNNPAERSQLENEAKLKQEYPRLVKFLKPLVDVFPADTATTPKSDQRLDYIFIDPGYKVKSKKVEKFKTSSGQPVSDHYGLGVQLVILGTHNNPAERSQLENEAKLKQEYPRLVKFLKPLVDVFPADTATTPKSDQHLDYIFIDPGYKVKSKKVEKFKTSSGQPVSDHYGLGVQLVILGTHNNPAERSQLENEAKLKQEYPRLVKFLKPLVDVFPADTATTPKSDQHLDYIFIDPGYKVKSKKVEKFKTSSGQPVSDHYGLGVQLVILGTHNNPAERSQLENEAKLKQEYPRLVKFLKPLVDVFPADTATTPKSDQRLDYIFIDPGYKVKSKKS